jgi:hypothetical protein
MVVMIRMRITFKCSVNGKVVVNFFFRKNGHLKKKNNVCCGWRPTFFESVNCLGYFLIGPKKKHIKNKVMIRAMGIAFFSNVKKWKK